MTAISETTRVLLVEDNPGDADLFRGALSNAAFGRFEIDTVGLLSDAALRTAAGDVDVVVLDLSLPDSLGIQTMREMRRAAPLAAIVVLTGENDERLGLEALNEGAQDYLVKGDSSGRTIARTLLFAIERRLLHEQLHRREALLAGAQQIARLGSFEWDIPGDRMTWSDELCGVYCIAAKDVEPSSAGFLERVRPDDRELVHDLFQGARNGKISVLDFEYRTLGPGNTLILHCRGHVLTNGAGRPSSMVAICQDVTERRKLEGALVLAGRMSSVGTMALGIAHEINNPLSYLLSNLEHIEREVKELATRSPSAPMRDLTDAVEQARHGADRVRRVVKGLRAFSRTGDQESRVLLELQPVLDGAITLTSNEIRHRARLVKDYGPTPQVDADEARLAQVFVNLLINAAQAIGDGPAKDNEIHVTTSTDKVGRAVVEIRDTGCGVPEANRAQISIHSSRRNRPGRGRGSDSPSFMASWPGTVGRSPSRARGRGGGRRSASSCPRAVLRYSEPPARPPRQYPRDGAGESWSWTTSPWSLPSSVAFWRAIMTCSRQLVGRRRWPGSMAASASTPSCATS